MGPTALPADTRNLIAQNPQLWPEGRRLSASMLLLNGFLLGSWIYALNTKKPRASGHPRFLWVLGRLYVVDLVFSSAHASLALWIGNDPATASSALDRVYVYLCSTSGSLLCVGYAGLVFLVGELQPKIWGYTREEKPPTVPFPASLFRVGNGLGWHMALSITTIRIAMYAFWHYRALVYLETCENSDMGRQMVAADDVLKGGAWVVWGNIAITTAMATVRFTRVIESRVPLELKDRWTSFIVDIFYLRIPALIVLAMIRRVLDRLQQREQQARKTAELARRQAFIRSQSGYSPLRPPQGR